MNSKPMNQTPIKPRRKFDETFKREAVQNWIESGKSAEVIARELGLDANRLYAWKKTFVPAGGRCKTVSVICLSSLQLHPFRVRGSEPSAAEYASMLSLIFLSQIILASSPAGM